MLHPSTKFDKNWGSSFSIILLTNEQTNRTESITSLAEVMKLYLKRTYYAFVLFPLSFNVLYSFLCM